MVCCVLEDSGLWMSLMLVVGCRCREGLEVSSCVCMR